MFQKPFQKMVLKLDEFLSIKDLSQLDSLLKQKNEIFDRMENERWRDVIFVVLYAFAFYAPKFFG